MTQSQSGGRFRRAVTGMALAAALSSASLIVGPQWQAVATEASTTVAIGESNTADQRAELLNVFGVEDSAAVVDVTVEETLTAWAGIFDLSGVDSAYSSTALTCTITGSGVAVSTSNIEIVPPELYALTLVTAGLTDVQLIVAAPDDAPALGMTALTGVFKTWDLSPCAGTGGDPERRDLALQELALVAGIGEAHGGADAVRSTTNLVLTLQQAVVLGQVATDGLDALVTLKAGEVGLILTADEQERIVDFLGQLDRSNTDWDAFATGWTVEQPGTLRVTMRPGEADDVSVEDVSGDDAVATGVGGAISTTQPVGATATSQPTETSRPTATIAVAATATATAPATTTPDSGVAGPVDVNGPTAGDEAGIAFPWWPLLALIPLALLILLIVRRHHQTPLVARQRAPVSAAEALAHRRAVESAAVAAVIRQEPTLRRDPRRPVTWRVRPGQGDA